MHRQFPESSSLKTSRRLRSIHGFIVLSVLAWPLAMPLAAEWSGAEVEGQKPFRPLVEVDVESYKVHELIARQKTPISAANINHDDPEVQDKKKEKYRFLYNDELPGEQLNVEPGETLLIRLVNRLEGLNADSLENLDPNVVNKNEPQATKDLIAASSSITNLHTHGLHVSPRGRSDNVMLRIPRGKNNLYSVALPRDHAPGTHWYHAHLHGSTALQVQGGMVGALIVEPSSLEQSLNPPGFHVDEWVMVLQFGQGWEFRTETDSARASDTSARTQLANRWLAELVDVETEAELVSFVNRLDAGDLQRLAEELDDRRLDLPPMLVNGVEDSVIHIKQDVAVQRLRVINTGSRKRDFKCLWLENTETGESVPMYVAAFDGVNLSSLPKDAEGRYITYAKPEKEKKERCRLPALELGAGNRADIFFVPDTAGSFALRMRAEVGLRDEAGNRKMVRSSSGVERPMRRMFERSLLSFEVGGPDRSGDGPEGGVSAADRDEFLRALDEHLGRLQRTMPAYRAGYLRPFEEHGDYITRNIYFNTKGYKESGQTEGAGKHSFYINNRNYNRPADGHSHSSHDPRGGHHHMGGHSDYLGKVEGDGGRGPNGETPWPLGVGTEEEWTIFNQSTQPHPFHIHVSPFWVVDIMETKKEVNDRENCKHAGDTFSVRATNPYDPRLDRWQDTLVLPPCGSVKVRHRVSDFTGLYVIHCHILQHEDRGMMINVLTVPNREEDPQWFFEQEMENNRRINEDILH